MIFLVFVLVAMFGVDFCLLYIFCVFMNLSLHVARGVESCLAVPITLPQPCLDPLG